MITFATFSQRRIRRLGRLPLSVLPIALAAISMGCLTQPATAQVTSEVPTTVEPTSTSGAMDDAKKNGAKKDDAQMDEALYRQTVREGITFLLESGQDADDGSFSKHYGPAVTSMCISALVKNGVPVSEPKVQKALQYVSGFIQSDGGIYAPNSNLRNYETSVSVMCFHQANTDGRYDETIDHAVAFLKGIQWDEAEGHGPDSRHYGGQGYGKHKRPDASNTSFFMDALKEVQQDAAADSEAFAKAIVFMSRCQNLPTPHNDATFAQVVSADDHGGFIYSAVGEGETKAESLDDTPNGGLRSYGSMTYAGLKSFVYAGIDRDDIRVKAAVDWIGRHYDLNSNPGVGQQGLYYYYHVFAKALQAYGDDTIIDGDGNRHHWRSDLLATLAEKQSEDGSWTNPSDRWYEGDPNLVTSYSLLALSYLKQN